MYAVKEIFYSLQGEGFHAGRPAVFCRFTGCNLWSGREQDRANAPCSFCDTDFVGTDGANGGKYDLGGLAYRIARLWPSRQVTNRLVIFTGGEPLLQLDEPLLQAMHALGFACAVETNGTLAVPKAVDWITVSPKAGAPLRLESADELKLVFPQDGLPPEHLEQFHAKHFFLQPMDSSELKANTAAAVAYCMANPKWRLSLQNHKSLGIP